jgi:hypothetical protein
VVRRDNAAKAFPSMRAENSDTTDYSVIGYL